MPNFETDRWTRLSAQQIAFFTGQIAAISETIFSPTAHEAGIIPINASRFTFNVGDGERPGVAWPDCHTPNTTCVVLDNFRNGHRTTQYSDNLFARTRISPEGMDIEGIATNLTYSKLGFYGKQKVQQPGPTPEDTKLSFAVNFLATARQEAEQIRRGVNSAEPLQQCMIGMVGVKGNVVGDLYRSMASIHNNVTVANVSPNVRYEAQRTYDLASNFLKAAIGVRLHSSEQDDRERGALILGPGGPIGAVFEADDQGLVAVHRPPKAYPDTITVTFVRKPGVDESHVFIEQHHIQAASTAIRIDTLRAEEYEQQAIAVLLADLDDSGYGLLDAVQDTRQDPQVRAQLDRRLVSLLDNRISVRI